MLKSTLINFRVDTNVKKEALEILEGLGVTPSDLFNNVLRFVIENKKLPVGIKIVDTSVENNYLKTSLDTVCKEIALEKNTFLSAPLGSGADRAIFPIISEILSQGNGCIVSDITLSSLESEKLLYDLVCQTGKVPHYLDLRKEGTNLTFGFNPLLNVSLDLIPSILFFNKLDHESELKFIEFLKTLKLDINSLNFFAIYEILSQNEEEICSFISKRDYLDLLSGISELNDSHFSNVINNTNPKINHNFKSILENNEFLYIQHDSQDFSTEARTLKRLLNYSLAVSLSNFEGGKNIKNNYFLCSNSSIFNEKVLLNIAGRGRRSKTFLIMHDINNRIDENRDYLLMVSILANCHNKLILNLPFTPDLLEVDSYYKGYFGSQIANIVNTKEAKQGIFVDENNDFYIID